MAARPESQEGKEAITHYEVLQRFTTCTLLAVRIETGRTHQIRAHMFAIGHPVAGDTLYTRNDIKPLELPRLFLHARALTIDLPSGERKTFEAPLPKELEDALLKLKKKSV
jgi:23S rRNA pseudouridine1911/1915/1917 synthase